MTEEREASLYFGSAMPPLADEDAAYERMRQQRIDEEIDEAADALAAYDEKRRAA